MNPKQRNAKAGWATVVVATDFRPASSAPPAAENAAASPEKSSDRHSIEKAVTSASCGRVVIMPATPGYDGATRHSNNTAELTALLRGIRDEASQTDGAPVQFCVDSTYAIGAALGKWQPRTNNRELVRRVQVAYARLRASRPPGAVSIRHVRAHARTPGNEAVDRLAKDGAAGALTGSGDDVLFHARDQYEFELATNLTKPRTGATSPNPQQEQHTHTSASTSAPPTSAQPPPSAQFSPAVVAHSLGVG